MGITIKRGTVHDERVNHCLTRMLTENLLASFATVDPVGQAYANTAYFAWGKDWSLYFYSYPDSNHAHNLLKNRSMAATIFDSRQRWGGSDRGIQLFGTGGEARGKAARKAESIYARRFPKFSRWRVEVERTEGTFTLRPYRFFPRRVVIFDETALGSGTFVKVTLPSPKSRS